MRQVKHSTRESKSLKVRKEVYNGGFKYYIFSVYSYISSYVYGIIEREITKLCFIL